MLAIAEHYGLTHADPRSLSFAELAANVLQAPYVILDPSPLPDDYDTLLIGGKSIKPGCAEPAAASAARKQGKRVAFVVTGAPYGARLLPVGCPAVGVYCLTPQTVNVALDVLTHCKEAGGTSAHQACIAHLRSEHSPKTAACEAFTGGVFSFTCGGFYCYSVSQITRLA